MAAGTFWNMLRLRWILAFSASETIMSMSLFNMVPWKRDPSDNILLKIVPNQLLISLPLLSPASFAYWWRTWGFQLEGPWRSYHVHLHNQTLPTWGWGNELLFCFLGSLVSTWLVLLSIQLLRCDHLICFRRSSLCTQ